MTDGQNFFDQSSDMRRNDNITKIKIGLGFDYARGCLLYYLYSKQHYKMIAIALSKQEAMAADLRTIQQTNFKRNVEWDGIDLI